MTRDLWTYHRRRVRAFLTRPADGQGLVEYALIILLIALGLIAATSALGRDLVSAYNDIASKIP